MVKFPLWHNRVLVSFQMGVMSGSLVVCKERELHYIGLYVLGSWVYCGMYGIVVVINHCGN
jgi:hypothetical protein